MAFDAHVDEISFDASVMDLPLVGYDPYLNDLMVKSCDEAIIVARASTSPFRTEVENTIAPLLPHAAGHCRQASKQVERESLKQVERESL
jgi:hypothetical protein